MADFYRPWTRVRDERFDGLIVTGAPVETLPFEQVAYWTDLCAIFDWARSSSLHSFYICWAAQAALYHQHAIPKHNLPEKAFGVFRHRLNKSDSNLLRGFSNDFAAPVSRHTEVRMADLPEQSGLKILAVSEEAGVCLIEDRSSRAVYMFNHIEYDTNTLADEFLRDQQAGKPVRIPCNYFPEDDPQRPPRNVWRSYGKLLFANWLKGIEANRLQVRREALIGWGWWTLGARSIDQSKLKDQSDLLIAVTDSVQTLPSLLRVLANAGTSPRRIKVHPPHGVEQLIEMRGDFLEQPGLELIARRLTVLPAVIAVAYRTHGDSGGWLVGKAGGNRDLACPEAA